ncbi:MAG TPA: LysR substrate-binding domain-containing protein [Azospirillaceae bacterium]|nr:LysR substrate-binding domain-containing protein [Azospirillaceae bacterium]
MAVFDIDLLRALVAVVDTGGFTAAAERLNRTQSAVSMQIKRLEGVCGRRLLERARSGVRPTEAGERLVAHARRILMLHDAAVQDLTGAQADGKVRLGMPDDYAATFLPPVIARFQAAFPRVEVEVRCELSVHLAAEVEAGRLDVALVTRRPGTASGRFVRREPLVWVGAAGHRPELADPVPLCVFPDACLFRPHMTAALESAGRRWRVAFTSGSHSGVLSAVACGLGLSALAHGTVPSGLRILGPADGLPPLPAVELELLEARPLSPAGRRLAAHLMAALADPLQHAA